LFQDKRKKTKGQTTQWTKEKRQKDKQRSTNDYTENKGASNTNHTKDGRKSSSCSTCGNWMVIAAYLNSVCFILATSGCT
jgi:hypothetical protein